MHARFFNSTSAFSMTLLSRAIASGVMVVGLSLFQSPLCPSLYAQEAGKQDKEATQEKEGSDKKESEDGQSLLDQATDLKLDAESPDDLTKVIEMAEKAIEAGLDADNQMLAKQLIASSAYQKAEQTFGQILQQRMRNPQALRRLRTAMLKDINKAIEADPTMADAYLLLAKLEEDRPKALEAVNKALEQLKNDPERRAKALVLRGALTEKQEDKLNDFKEAAELDPSNLEAWQAKIAIQAAEGKFEEAHRDAMAFLEKQPKNMLAIQMAAAALKELDRKEEAIKLLGEKAEEIPEATQLLLIRSELLIEVERYAEAVTDLDRVVDADPRNGVALLSRARVHLQMQNYEKAEQDIEDVLLLQPNQPGAIYLRSLIAAQQKHMDEAIDDLMQLVKLAPDNAEFLLQLAGYYQMDDRPKKAIQVADEILKSNKEEWKIFHSRALRTRGDARLAIGEHTDAIKDFEEALKLVDSEDSSERSGLLNNLAWVLATSPVDEIRNGQRAVTLGKEACELTEFKQAHILSTLAAAYAEIGDFEEAKKWAEKAVEQGREDKSEQLGQLEEELESYKQSKPWREKQETNEKKQPIVPSSGVDT